MILDLPPNVRTWINLRARTRIVDLHTRDSDSPLGLTFGQEMQDELERRLSAVESAFEDDE